MACVACLVMNMRHLSHLIEIPVEILDYTRLNSRENQGVMSVQNQESGGLRLFLSPSSMSKLGQQCINDTYTSLGDPFFLAA